MVFQNYSLKFQSIKSYFVSLLIILFIIKNMVISKASDRTPREVWD